MIPHRVEKEGRKDKTDGMTAAIGIAQQSPWMINSLKLSNVVGPY